MGKDQYYDSVEGMINGRILPWVQDSESESYPIWSDFGASQGMYFSLIIMVRLTLHLVLRLIALQILMMYCI